MTTMNAHEVAIAAPTDSNTLVILSSVLGEFFDENAASTIVASSKILTKLLQNAMKDSADPKFRRVRLSNYKIQEHVVRVKGALDVLGLAGFVDRVVDHEKVLLYEPKKQNNANPLNLYLEDGSSSGDIQPDHALIQAICSGLENKLKELEPWSQQQEAQSPLKVPSRHSTSSSSNGNGPFLSDEERRKRAADIKAKKKAMAKERAMTKARWNENMADRKIAEQRRETLLSAKAASEARNGLAKGITIRPATTKENGLASGDTVLPKPFAPAPDVDTQKRQMAALARERYLQAQQQQREAAVDNSPAANDTPMDVEASATASQPETMDVDEEQEIPAVTIKEEGRVVSAATSVDSLEWNAFLERVPLCSGAEGIRESSCFHAREKESDAMTVPMCLKRLFKELDGLKEMLPSDHNCSIWLRFDEETPQYIRALLTAPLPGPTPYSGGLFFFDIFVPGTYPQVSPKVQLLTTGQGTVRFGPNLYRDGKVCLSLLNTWEGPKWNPAHSSLYQVLISIQALILGVEHPYFLEPGHGGWEGQVKDGRFHQQGHTLDGQRVRAEIGVPPEVVLYEDQIRLGTAEFAMLEPLRAARSSLQQQVKTSKEAIFHSFGDIIQAHFGHNRSAIVAEVCSWMSDATYGRVRSAISGNGSQASHPIDKLKTLLPKLQDLFAEIPPLAVIGMAQSIKDENEMVPESDKKMPARSIKVLPPVLGEPKTRGDSTKSGDVLSQKRQQWNEASSRRNYVLAGKLQAEIKRMEDLEQAVQEAAQQSDFVRAGRLQLQLQSLIAAETDSTNNTKSTDASMWDADNASGPVSQMWNEGDEESSMNIGGGGMPTLGVGDQGHVLGKNVFAPPSYKNTVGDARHWNSLVGGCALGDKASNSETADDYKGATVASAKKQSVQPDQLCRLRIRLPNNKSVVEDFHKSDQLSVVYRRLVPLVQDEHKKNSAVAVAPSIGAFSKPLSSAGFTLLLTRPKREFSLEMHATKSLFELNLAPSATLTVMQCSDRGVLYRGELESRLQEANGMAMDLDGLTYEGLVELTERVGQAAPKDGEAFVSMTAEELEQNSETFSPSSYLSDLEKGDQSERKCQICLGEYDPTDKTCSLRKLNNCGHQFHLACLATWLQTKSSCPLCKTPVKPET